MPAVWTQTSAPGSKRTSNEDVIARFKKEGYVFASTDTELKKEAPAAKKLLGLFHPGNMDGALDRKFLKKGTVEQFPDQPDLPDMVRAALDVLAKNPNGFVLEVESGLIDKYQHKLDWERAVYATIMLDKAVEVAKEFAKANPDTLILVTSDHTHAMGIVGTFDDDRPGSELRDKLGVYQDAGFPNYPAPNKDGYPETVDVSRQTRASGFRARVRAAQHRDPDAVCRCPRGSNATSRSGCRSPVPTREQRGILTRMPSATERAAS